MSRLHMILGGSPEARPPVLEQFVGNSLTRVMEGERLVSRMGAGLRSSLVFGVIILALSSGSAQAEWSSNRLVVVREPGAVTMAVHPVQPWLAVGRQGMTGEAVRIYRLEGNGQPATSAWVTLSAPPVAAGVKPQTVVDLMFHPREPLLYVRWDWPVESLKDPATRAASTNLGSVGIYQLTEKGLDRTESFARGKLFFSGLKPGRMAIEAGARRLYLSNLTIGVGAGSGLGSLPLLTNGWPRLSDGEWVPVTVNVEILRSPPNGFGFMAFSNAVIFGTQFGPATWDAGNRLAPLGVLPIRELANQVWVGGAAEVPAAYSLEVERNLACSVAQSDGFLSGRPQTLAVAGAAFCAPPAVITRVPMYVAAPSLSIVHLLSIDAAGRFDGTVESLPVSGGGVRDMKYSPRTDRLYVLQETSP
jgi:hypothetical protein